MTAKIVSIKSSNEENKKAIIEKLEYTLDVAKTVELDNCIEQK